MLLGLRLWLALVAFSRSVTAATSPKDERWLEDGWRDEREESLLWTDGSVVNASQQRHHRMTWRTTEAQDGIVQRRRDIAKRRKLCEMNKTVHHIHT